MNQVAIPGGIPAHILKRQQARQSMVSAALQVTDVDDLGDRLSIRGGIFRVVKEGVETEMGPYCDVIIVGANPRNSKTFYANAE